MTRKSKHFLVFLILLTFVCSVLAHAQGITLYTVSTFSGNDVAANTYASILKTWQEETGNIIIDDSETADENWKTGVLKDFAAGNEADVLFFFANTADSAVILDYVVPISEINEAYPSLNLPEDSFVMEPDGVVYAIPVRPYWEALFCNVPLFEQFDLALPTDWDSFMLAIETFASNGIIPISVSLTDVPHYLVEFCMLASGSLEDYQARPQTMEEVPQSWLDAMDLLRELYDMGAFASNATATTESAMTSQFLNQEAAMQFDGSWFANSLTSEQMETIAVVPFPLQNNDEITSAYLYGVSMGFYLTRSAWDDTHVRDEAVALLSYLSTGENALQLGDFQLSGLLNETYETMQETITVKASPLQDDMNAQARAYWFSAIPSIISGQITPDELWETLMEMNPFTSP